MREINGYNLNGKIFLLPLIISLVLLSSIVYIEGFDVFKKTETFICPIQTFSDCQFNNGLRLIPGETITLNQQDNVLIQYFNFLPLILIVCGLIINHYKHNRKQLVTV